jgi:hypothetical protein
VEPALGETVAVGSQAITAVEPAQTIGSQPLLETASLETHDAEPVAGEGLLPETSPTAKPDPALPAEALERPPSYDPSSRDTIRRSRRSLARRSYRPVIIALAGLLLLLSIFYFMGASKPADSDLDKADIAAMDTPQKTAQPIQPPPRAATLEAPDWLLGRWGIEGDCTNILLFTKETGAELGVQVGENGPVSKESILGKMVAELNTNEARYVLELPYMTRISVFPRGSNSYGLKRCRKS